MQKSMMNNIKFEIKSGSDPALHDLPNLPHLNPGPV